jgi:hypothetical protein
MSGRTLVSALVLVVLAAPPAAAAKGVQDARVCGADGCVTAPLNADTYVLFEGGTPVAAPARRAPFFELRYRRMTGESHDIDALESVRMIYVPSAGLLRADDGQWLQADRRAAAAMRRALTGTEPFPAAKLGLPGVPQERPAPGSAGTGDGPPVVPLLALAVLGGGAALAVGSRRRRRPAAG